jgi:hypothetical protein
MKMNRRKFFSVLAAAPVALPMIAKVASERTLASGGILADFVPGVAGEALSGEAILPLSPFRIKSFDLRFVAARRFQLQEMAQIFRIPCHSVDEQMAEHDIFDAA